MKYIKHLAMLTCCISVSCSIDQSYDFNKKIDMTMQFNVDGLAARLGSTEKIYLKDIIQHQNNASIKEKNNLYYIAVEGKNSISGNVPSVPTFSIPSLTLFSGSILQSPISIPSTGSNRSLTANLTQRNIPMHIYIPNVPDAIKELHAIWLTDSYIRIYYNLSNDKFKAETTNEVLLTFPSFIKSSDLDSNNQLRVNVASQGRISIKIDGIEIPEQQRKITGGVIDYTDNVTISATNLKWNIAENQSVSIGETLSGNINLNFPSISPKKIVGVVDYSFAVNSSAIAINADDVPDFIRKGVQIPIKNPTLKVSFTNNPISMGVSGTIRSEKNNATIGAASIPYTTIDANAENTLYLSPTDTPFDAVEYPSQSTKIKIDGLTSLITQIPDYVKVSLKTGTNPEKIQTLELGKYYQSDIAYTVFIPFEFSGGLSLVYSDVTSSIKLEDYQASKLEIHFDVENAIPLGLRLNVVPLDEAGNVVNGLEISNIQVKAGSVYEPSTSAIALEATQKIKNTLSKIKRFRFEITAQGTENGGALMSNQYIKINNIRIKLKGAITKNFN